ncbi:MAG: hypothetical protein P4N60_03375 [Verrucomicrobiae bacterium]|nr:hypothetical protein [Verrucomicrobiae bacterium]
MKRILKYNAVTLIALYGVWLCGWFMSDDWLHIIDFGAPWSWFAVFFTSSLFAQRRQCSKTEAFVGSLGGAIWTWMLFWVLCFLSLPFVDPHW